MIRPRGMSQAALAALLRQQGFKACSKVAVSLAERPEESGVQFTPAARNAAQEALQRPRRAENRTNGRKTTVWLDEDMRIWCETRAYLDGCCVGELLRRLVRAAMDQTKAAEAVAAAPAAEVEDILADNSTSDYSINKEDLQA